MVIKLKCHVRIGDEVKVIVGDDKGKIGRVLRVIRRDSGKVKIVVEGVAKTKRAVKKDKDPSGYRELFLAVDPSNVKLVRRKEDAKGEV